MTDIESSGHFRKFRSNAVSPDPLIESKDMKYEKKSIKVTWSDIKYAIPMKKEQKINNVLNNVHGEACPGEILAIMGTSGAGKSTLLDVIAGRLDSKYLTGSICAEGEEVDKRKFRRESGYVMQSDALFPLLTVRETLQYAAELRIIDKSKAEKKQIADDVINILRLSKCANTIIGNDKIRGISGGEKRRVSIGSDIVHQPMVIFLDEPTSGLDSTTAFAIVDSLKHMAIERQCTIIMTIHQPSARIFELIDKVHFLSNGRTTYSGRADQVQEFIERMHFELKLGKPRLANAPELFLDMSDMLIANNQIGELTKLFQQDDNHSAHLVRNKSQIAVPIDRTGITYANSIIGEVSILSKRALSNILRTKELFLARLASTIFFATLSGTLFLFPKNNDLGINMQASYFVLTLAYFFWQSLEALPIFFEEREIFQREFSGGSYRALSYTIASSIVYFPFLLILSVVYTMISWWLISLPDESSRFLFQVLIIFIVLIAGSSFATMLSVIVPDAMTGQTVGSAIFAIMFLFSGYFIKRELIPNYWKFFHYLSLFKYALDSQLVNGLKGYAHTATLNNDEILKEYGIDNVNKWFGFGILILWTLLYRVIFHWRLITAFNGSRTK